MFLLLAVWAELRQQYSEGSDKSRCETTGVEGEEAASERKAENDEKKYNELKSFGSYKSRGNKEECCKETQDYFQQSEKPKQLGKKGTARHKMSAKTSTVSNGSLNLKHT